MTIKTMRRKELHKYYETELLPVLRERVKLLSSERSSPPLAVPARGTEIRSTITFRQVLHDLRYKKENAALSASHAEDIGSMRQSILATQILIQEIKKLSANLAKLPDGNCAVEHRTERMAGLSVLVPTPAEITRINNFNRLQYQAMEK